MSQSRFQRAQVCCAERRRTARRPNRSGKRLACAVLSTSEPLVATTKADPQQELLGRVPAGSLQQPRAGPVGHVGVVVVAGDGDDEAEATDAFDGDIDLFRAAEAVQGAAVEELLLLVQVLLALLLALVLVLSQLAPALLLAFSI